MEYYANLVIFAKRWMVDTLFCDKKSGILTKNNLFRFASLSIWMPYVKLSLSFRFPLRRFLPSFLRCLVFPFFGGGMYHCNLYGIFLCLQPLRKMKTSDFFDGKFRCFALKVRHIDAKKSGVFNFRNLLSTKKVL